MSYSPLLKNEANNSLQCCADEETLEDPLEDSLEDTEDTEEDGMRYQPKESHPISTLIKGVFFGLFVNLVIDYHSLISTEQAQQRIKGLLPKANLSDYLFKTTRVLCIVMTNEEAFKAHGFNISDTWGKRCNKLLFFSETTGEF